MKVKNMFWGLMAAAWALTACTQEEVMTELSGAQEEGVEVSEITVKMPEFEAEDGTRVIPNSSMRLSWEDNDKVGILYMKNKESSVCIYEMKEKSEDGKTGLFSNIGFKLKPGERYSVLYPYDQWVVDDYYYFPHIIANYQTEDKWQREESFEWTAADNMRNYTFLYGDMTVDANGKGTVQLESMGAYLRFTVHAPYWDAEYTNMYVEFYKSGMRDLPITSAYYANGSYYKESTSGNYQLKLQLGNGESGKRGNLFYAHMMVPEQSLVNRMVVKLEDKEGFMYTSESIDIPNGIERGKAYSLTAQNFTMDGLDLENSTINGREFVDFGITDAFGYKVYWATTNLGADEPGGTGLFYSWGSTESLGYLSGNVLREFTFIPLYDDGYTYANYKWTNSYGHLLKYTDIYNYQMHNEDDAATANWGAGWYIPTQEHYDLLKENCYWQYDEKKNAAGVTVKGMSAYVPKCEEDKGKRVGTLTSQDKGPTESYGPKDPHIFFPEVKFYEERTYAEGYEGRCFYMTRTKMMGKKYIMPFVVDYRYGTIETSTNYEVYNMSYGYAVRPVFIPKKNIKP